MSVLKTLFIVNPISGASKGEDIANHIANYLTRQYLDWELIFTKAAGHATSLAQEAVEQKYDLVVAVGGDGTINEVAKALVNTNTVLGIIPLGSGNGLARHLNLSLDYEMALHRLERHKVVTIDSGLINNESFFCTTGTGFDAKVSHKFAKASGRGLSNYVKAGLKMYLQYQPSVYKIEVDGKTYEELAYMVTVANASQFGNDAFIAPEAVIDDGELNITILRNFSKWKGVSMMKKTFNKTLPESKHVLTLKGKNIKIWNMSLPDQDLIIHRDGEPEIQRSPLSISIVPQSIKIAT